VPAVNYDGQFVAYEASRNATTSAQLRADAKLLLSLPYSTLYPVHDLGQGVTQAAGQKLLSTLA
jgi:hypothetical protein